MLYLLIIFTKIKSFWNFLPITYALHVPTVLVLCFSMNKLKIAMKRLCDMLVKLFQYMYSECSIELLYKWKLWQGEPFKPEPNMLKISLIIPSSTSKKLPIILSYLIYSHNATNYSHIILLH